MKELIQMIREFIFGLAARGEKPSEPSFRSSYPEGYEGEFSEVNFSRWFNEVNFGKVLEHKPIYWS